MMKKAVIIFIFILKALSISANSQIDSLQNLPEIVITGTPVEVSKNNIPLTISVVSRNEIEQSSESALLPVLSEWVPGLFVTERGLTGFGVSTGSAGTVNIRGIGNSNKILVLFDGQPQWAGLFGHLIPDTYVASDAERVEVIRGPGSLLYGSNAMGGVINIITRKQQTDGWNNQARIMYGSYNTQKYMVNSGFKKNKFNNFFSLNYDRTDGHRENSSFHILNGYYKAGYEINNHWDLAADVMLAKFKSENPGKTDAPMIDNWVNALRGTASASIQNNYDYTGGALKAFYNFGEHEVNDGWQNGQPRNYLFESRDHVGGLMLYQYLKLLKGNTFTLGFDYKNWGGNAWNKLNSGGETPIIDRSVNESGIYAVIQQELGSKLSLNGGIRLEINETYGNEWIPQAGAAWKLNNWVSFKTSYSKGFRSPNIRELYMYQPANPDLKPEYLNNYDLSVLYSHPNNRFHFELTGFIADGKDLIQVQMIDGKPKNMNSGAINNKGFEFALKYYPVSRLKISANYSYLYMKNPLPAAPQNLAFIDINYTWKKVNFDMNTQIVDGLYTQTGDNPETEDYCLLNAKISYRPVHWTNIFLKGENLTDTNYEINAGFPMPGIVIFGGANFYF